MERHDYYLKYVDGSLTKELEVKNIGYEWRTYNAEQEIENEEFLSQISELGPSTSCPGPYTFILISGSDGFIFFTSEPSKEYN